MNMHVCMFTIRRLQFSIHIDDRNIILCVDFLLHFCVSLLIRFILSAIPVFFVHTCYQRL